MRSSPGSADGWVTTDSLVKDAAAVGLSVAEFLAAIEEDWATLGVLYPGHVPAAWRTGRLMFTVTCRCWGGGWRWMRRNRSRRSGRSWGTGWPGSGSPTLT